MSTSDREAYFTRVFRQNLWEGRKSRSGPGSEGAFGEGKKRILSEVVDTFGIRSVLDLGCGDLAWMKDLLPSLDRYLGVDIVGEMVETCRALHGSEAVTFQKMDITLPKGWAGWSEGEFDLCVALDLFGHLLNPEVDALLGHLSRWRVARYLLVTNRRDPSSSDYLRFPKSRSQGIDIHIHPLVRSGGFPRLLSRQADWPNDYFELYHLVN